MRRLIAAAVLVFVFAGCGPGTPVGEQQRVTLTAHDVEPELLMRAPTYVAPPPTTTVPTPSSVVEGEVSASVAVAAAQPPPTTRPAPRPPAPTGDVADLIRSYFGDVGDSAVRVADCESSLDPSAVSPGGGNYGLFQINRVHADDFEAVTGHPWSDVLDAEQNTVYALHLYRSQGWGPWACRWAA